MDFLKKHTLFLASGSPRRADLMRQAGFLFTVINNDVDESYPENLDVTKVAEYLSLVKAEAAKEFIVDAHHWLILHGRYCCIARKPKCGECIVADVCNWKDRFEFGATKPIKLKEIH